MAENGFNPSSPVVSTSATTELESHVTIFYPSMSVGTIKTKIDDVYKDQVNNEMGGTRYCFLFKPGTYGSPTEPLLIQLGYYMEIAGLGTNPADVTIYGRIEVYSRFFEADKYSENKSFIPAKDPDAGNVIGLALNSFWRSLSNVSINVVLVNQNSHRFPALVWAVSQASSLRRVDIIGAEVSLCDYYPNYDFGWASGGFIADTRAQTIKSGTQQQFLTRNSEITKSWEQSNWNQVFVGVKGAPSHSFPSPPFTTIATTPLSREKPYLYLETDENGSSGYFVRVPNATRDSNGITWGNDQVTPGSSIPLEDFLIATPLTTTVDVINKALSNKKHVLFTPGVYDIDSTIKVTEKDTVIIGLGLATLTARNGVIPLQIADQPGIVVAGLTFDAGEKLSDVLLQIGTQGSAGASSNPDNPITLSDVYFRVGGPHIGKANICLEINSDNVLVDHTWVWRADHGVEKFDENDGYAGDNERWRTNIGRVGVVVNGNNVIITGLFVEHFQEHNVIWNGNNGKVYFFQNELPYDPPTQKDWTKPDGTLGWAAYKVADHVTDHEFWGGGVYCNNRNCPSIVTINGFEVPDHPGVKFQSTNTVSLDGIGTISSVINGIGEEVGKNKVNKPTAVPTYPSSA